VLARIRDCLSFALTLAPSLLKSRAALQLENIAVHYQIGAPAMVPPVIPGRRRRNAFRMISARRLSGLFVDRSATGECCPKASIRRRGLPSTRRFSKTFVILERMRLQFRGEFFTRFNHPNFRANSLVNQFDALDAASYTEAKLARRLQLRWNSSSEQGCS